MTPEERANSLENRFSKTHYMKLSKAQLPISMYRSQVLQCAIEAVQQIQLENCKGSEFKNPKYQDERYNYWQDVKEILLDRLVQ